MTLNITSVNAQVPLDNTDSFAPTKNNLVEGESNKKSDNTQRPQERQQDKEDSREVGVDLSVREVPIARGTYTVHEERCLSVPDFYDSAYSRKQPWQDKQTNFGLQPTNYGHFRSFFNTKGDYRNFFDMFGISKAPSFYQQNQTPSFYSDEGNCTETSINIAKRGTEYQTYRPFAVEARGYMRSYFYGVT